MGKKYFYYILIIFIIVVTFSCHLLESELDELENMVNIEVSISPDYLYNDSQTVTVKSDTNGAMVYYTDDGSTPSESNFTGKGEENISFIVSSEITVKAISIRDGYDSDIVTKNYVYKCSNPVFSIEGGNYDASQDITLTSLTNGAMIYYIINEDNPSDSNNDGSNLNSVDINGIYNSTLQAIAIKSAYEDSKISKESYGKLYSIRNRGPAGGWIIYAKSDWINGWRYLEAAPEDQTSCIWGTRGISLSGAQDSSRGGGYQNTLDIIAGDSASNKAADICTEYSLENNGILYDDWYLPTKYEASSLQNELYLNGISNFNSSYYWTSYEQEQYDAWMQPINSNIAQYGWADDKDVVKGVRAIRRF